MVGPGQSAATREFGWQGDGAHFDAYVEAHWREFINDATFAIEAMREPTEEMLKAVGANNRDYFGGETESLYTAMIDAALTPEKEASRV